MIRAFLPLAQGRPPSAVQAERSSAVAGGCNKAEFRVFPVRQEIFPASVQRLVQSTRLSLAKFPKNFSFGTPTSSSSAPSLSRNSSGRRMGCRAARPVPVTPFSGRRCRFSRELEEQSTNFPNVARVSAVAFSWSWFTPSKFGAGIASVNSIEIAHGSWQPSPANARAVRESQDRSSKRLSSRRFDMKLHTRKGTDAIRR